MSLLIRRQGGQTQARHEKHYVTFQLPHWLLRNALYRGSICTLSVLYSGRPPHRPNLAQSVSLTIEGMHI